MPTLLLVRHGRTAANTGGVLAGRTPGVGLDDTGRAQVAALAQRLAPLPLVRVVASPLQRCQETAAALLATGGTDEAPRPELLSDEGLSECDYGDWTGQKIGDLVKDPLWPAVQAHPSSVVFPGGESMRGMQQRALDVVRRVDAEVAAQHGEHAVWVAVSHGDVIKAVLADALGVHLDAFQRIVVDPASVSVVRYTPLRPFAVRTNDTGGDVASLIPPPRLRRPPTPWSAAAPGRFPAMARQVFDYDPPERFVAGTTGPPGGRTFFLQARSGTALTSVALEKTQVTALAERVEELLDEVVRRSGGSAPVPAVTPADARDDAPLDTPIEEEFRVGTMTLAWDGDREVVVIECFEVGGDDEDAELERLTDADDARSLLRVSLPGAPARAFAARALAVVAAGRPPCPFCGDPLDPAGHVCPRANGYRR